MKKIMHICLGLLIGVAAMYCAAEYIHLHKGEAATPVAKADATKQDAVQPTPVESPGVPEKVEEWTNVKDIPYPTATPKTVAGEPAKQNGSTATYEQLKASTLALQEALSRQDEQLDRAQKHRAALQEQVIQQMKALSASQMENKMLKEALAKK